MQTRENGTNGDLIDLRAPAVPPLEGEAAVWTQSLHKEQGRR